MSFSDDFDDNNLDATKWDTCLQVGWSVAETNQQLEITHVAEGGWNVGGIVSVDTHDLSNSWISVDVTSQDALPGLLMYICLTKVTASDPWNENDFYFIRKWNFSDQVHIYSRIAGGDKDELYNESWTAETGELKIEVSGSDILFYENGGEVYSETNELSSNEVYIYLIATSNNWSGTDAYDTFNSNIGGAVAPAILPIVDGGIIQPLVDDGTVQKIIG